MYKSNFPFILYSFLIYSFLIFSCNTNKNTSEAHSIDIELLESLTEEYITSTYVKYKPSSISPSNKTLNSYRVEFNCSRSDFTELKGLLANDENVIQGKTTKNKKIQSSESTNRVKTKPINKNN